MDKKGPRRLYSICSGELEEQDALNPALKYYICGSADMVVEARDILISKGIPFGSIISEIYF